MLNLKNCKVKYNFYKSTFLDLKFFKCWNFKIKITLF